jgi:hypothetical protein
VPSQHELPAPELVLELEIDDVVAPPVPVPELVLVPVLLDVWAPEPVLVEAVPSDSTRTAVLQPAARTSAQ